MNNIYSLTILRVFCVLQVFFLHYFAGIGLLNYTWIFSVAVPIFLLVSAYLYGLKIGENEKLKYTFLLKRYKALSVVYYPFIIGVFIYYCITDFGNVFSYLKSAVFELLYLTKFVKPLPDCGHLWFMQILIICYISLFIVTNVSLFTKLFKNDLMSFLIFLFIVFCGFIYRGNDLIYLFFYIWTFFNAKRISKWSLKINTILLSLILCSGYLILSTQYKLLFKMGIYFEYIQVCIMAIFTIILFLKIFYNVGKSKLIIWFSTISMEFYLIHHLFVFKQPIYISFTLTIILSLILFKISKYSLTLCKIL